MATDLALRSARVEARQARDASRIELARSLTHDASQLLDSALKNPAVTLVGGTILINQAYRHNLISPTQAYAIEAALFTPAFLSALSPIASLLAKV